MFYPFIIVISVISYSNADRIVGHPDSLFIINIYIIDGIAVHGIITIVIGYNIWFAFIGVYIHFVNSCAIGGDQYLIITKDTDTVDTNIFQTRFQHDRVMKVQVIHEYSFLKRSNKYFITTFMEIEFIDLELQCIKFVTRIE